MTYYDNGNEVDMSTCAHHWIIETPHGPRMLKAACRLCKEKRLYHAAFQDPEYARIARIQAEQARKRHEEHRLRKESRGS